jgi:glycine oxidase
MTTIYPMSTSTDIAIVGGGIIGLTTAYFLAREGRRVMVLDKSDFGQEASWAGAGILPAKNCVSAPTAFEQLRAHSVGLFPALSRELQERTGIDNGYRRCGGLEFLDLADDGHTEEWHSDMPAAVPLSCEVLFQLEPHLALDLGPVLHLPEMAQVRNPRHLKALQAACKSLGVLLKPQCPVLSLDRSGQRIVSLQSPDGPVYADSYLIAAGAWTDELLGLLGWQAGIQPIRGQMVLLSAPSVSVHQILLCGPRYLVPRGDGRILVGSTEEDVGFDKQNTAIAVQELLSLACRLVPDLRSAKVDRCWSGLRPGSPDALPFLGRVPGCDNLFLASGHYRAGIQLSPGTGQVMSELMLGRPTTVPLDPFRLDRRL